MKNKHATKEEIEAFLKAFKERANLFGLFYVDEKPNNIDTLIYWRLLPKTETNMFYRSHPKTTVKDQTRTIILTKTTFGFLEKLLKGKRCMSKSLSTPD